MLRSKRSPRKPADSIDALYSNFASKDELFLQLMARRTTDRASSTINVLFDWHEHADPPWQALGQVMAEVADNDAGIAPLQAEFWLYAVRHPEAMATFASTVRQRRAPLKLMLANELTRFGIEDADDIAERASVVVAALFQGMVRQRRIDPDSTPPELYADALRWLFTGMLGGHQAAGPVAEVP